LRLREEVDILQHLSRAAAAGGRPHPNVLAYIDSWEEDEALFIQTELCELGNFARFLWEYGKAFARLDEARVWKVFADLSNGLRFIHESGVIHLDLKPANIFLTQEGRFKIGDFGMASLWPRASGGSPLAREVLQGTYGRAADIFRYVCPDVSCPSFVISDQ
jgi:mitosis inhibitor protein kinase SWE1